MKTLHVTLLTAFAATLAAGAPVVGAPATEEDDDAAAQTAAPSQAPLPPGGPLRTMPVGTYQCALPGDAAGPAFRVVESEEFRISTASRYTDTAGGGTYIMRGRELVFTSGPKRGERFRRIGDNQLRQLSAGGDDTDLLCTRLGSR